MKKYHKLFFAFLLLFISFFIYPKGNINKPRWVTAEPGLRMRMSPDLKAKRICTIPYAEEVILLEEKGEVIVISGEKGKWSKVKWEGKTGWVFGGFLNKEDPYAAGKIKSLEGKYILTKDPYKEQFIEFKKDGTCKARRNFCQGFATEPGEYTIENGTIIVILKDHSAGIELILKILNKKELIMINGAVVFTCGNFIDEDKPLFKLKK